MGAHTQSYSTAKYIGRYMSVFTKTLRNAAGLDAPRNVVIVLYSVVQPCSLGARMGVRGRSWVRLAAPRAARRGGALAQSDMTPAITDTAITSCCRLQAVASASGRAYTAALAPRQRSRRPRSLRFAKAQ